MNINQPMIYVRRKRSPLIDLDPPKPLAVGDVCPHCGRVVPAIPNAETLKAETGNETPAPVETPKPKESRDDDTTY
ncbi:MAG: hypothetical protein WCS94_07205 [Verrucomicrobiota bacterium]